MWNGAATMENSMEVPKKIKIKVPYDSAKKKNNNYIMCSFLLCNISGSSSCVVIHLYLFTSQIQESLIYLTPLYVY